MANVKIGTLIRNNDPRHPWVVPVLEIELGLTWSDSWVVIKPRPEGRLVKVRFDRIFDDGQERHQGYNVVLTQAECNATFDRAAREHVEHHRFDDDGNPHGGAGF